jgi:hypothetical protein
MAAIKPRSEGPPQPVGREPGSLGVHAQLRSERGAGVASVDELSVDDGDAASAAGAAVSAGALVVDESVGAVLFSVADGSAAVLAGVAVVSVAVGAVVCVVVVVVVSVDCATATPMPASRAAAAATADNFF